ncbi:glycoside hydrolase 15 protein [Irineochytrium annulatum]|nr:glycoside hydrolase 15 protein [Irineochytrium annulatum]
MLASAVAASTQVNVISYNFDGTTLTGTLNVQNIAYQKAIFVKYDTSSGSWSGSCNAVYSSGPASNNYETWSFSCPIDSNGISQFYVEYDVANKKYYDNGCGLTNWFTDAFPVAVQKLKANIHPANTNPGVVVAAPQSNTINNYFFHWIRDSALVMTAINDLYLQGDSSAVNLYSDYQTFTHGIQQLNLQGGLGEAKVLVNGQDFTDGWCRPQNDGPALRASSFIRFAKAYLAKTNDMSRVLSIYNGTQGVVVADLNFVATPDNYNNGGGCDLWEERRGIYFFTLGAQRKALHEGAAFAASLGDTRSANAWSAAASVLDSKMNSFINPSTGLVGRGNSDFTLDSAITLGAIHNAYGGVLDPADDRILNSIYVFAKSFANEYNINKGSLTDKDGLPISYGIGRYNNDNYDGSANNNNGGRANPWFLTTMAYGRVVLALALELYYKTATIYIEAGKVTVSSTNLPFFTGARPAGLAVSGISAGQTYNAGSTQFNDIVGNLQALADTYARSVKIWAGPNFQLNEQFSRETGKPTGVNDLTWSYASLISASIARNNMLAAAAGQNPDPNAVPRRR